ncbi:E3 ubiquitin-protein ligase Trim36-like [Saccostrea echinata]|uniref:E3 ubiquitin-protein ligase Trim36-like n=1 Tax=Saccostrea echinata TaxID=191078 RepID=UPI002A80E4B5|nr:E3 ubiquitin-protein ligase Trim36-like [Saccostrea echinata]
MDAVGSGLYPCFLCNKQINIPRDFPCQHTFCEPCIQKLIEKSEAGEYRTLECPVCLDEFTISSKDLSLQDLVELFPINNLVENLICSGDGNKARKSCDPCRVVNEKKEAIFHCRTCRQSMCEMCYKYLHRRILDQDFHQVSSVNDYFESFQIEVNERCPVHPKKQLELYCHDHDKPCCNLCMSDKHKTCLKVGTLDQLFETRVKHKSIELAILKILLNSIREKTTAAIDTLHEKEKTEVFRRMEKRVSTFVSAVQETLKKLHKNYETHQKCIKVSDGTLLSSIKAKLTGFRRLLYEMKYIIQMVDQVGSKQSFVAAAKFKQQLALYFRKIQKLSELRTEHTLQINSQIQELENVESVAELEENVLDTLLTSEIHKHVQLFAEYVDVGLEDITCPSSDIVPKKRANFTYETEEYIDIYDGVVLSSGRIFLINRTCYSTGVLLEVNKNAEFTELHRFRDPPTTICVDSMEKNIAVSMKQKLYKFSIYPTLKLTREIETSMPIRCMYFFNEIFLCSNGSDIAVMNRNGDIVRKLPGSCSENGRFALSHDLSRIYCIRKNMILCSEIDGSVVFIRKTDFIDWERVSIQDISLDGHGNLYVCAGKNIIQISKDGDKARTLIDFTTKENKVKKRDSESDEEESESDDGSDRVERKISFDKTGKRFLLCSHSETVDLYEIMYE